MLHICLPFKASDNEPTYQVPWPNLPICGLLFFLLRIVRILPFSPFLDPLKIGLICLFCSPIIEGTAERAGTPYTPFQRIEEHGIVTPPSPRLAENLVCLVDPLNLLVPFALVAIRVQRFDELSIPLLNLLLCRSGAHSQHAVEILWTDFSAQGLIFPSSCSA